MGALTIHPESQEQLETVKAILKALKVPFESKETSIPNHIEKSIERSMDQFSAGNSISLEAFKEKHFRRK
ncbi:DUF2683 family protein [Sphingobacterium prati]|jgi:hypothetical protein|uniref:DUF2683 family protein n=1 Tax=Sphingobacterium prati TaxID=2737006 RepID=UPI00155234F1|nr:DUF2683 family protein [Sphingobacterium prati]NPE45157.1 hypothetical protein [Sphingobacterium prati]